MDRCRYATALVRADAVNERCAGIVKAAARTAASWLVGGKQVPLPHVTV
jgi:hypothetical protein